MPRRTKTTLIALAALAVSSAPAQAMPIQASAGLDNAAVVVSGTPAASAPGGGGVSFFIICGGRC